VTKVCVDHQTSRPRSGARLAGRVGAFGILFFTVKGLLWLVIPAILYWLR
jgi:hypothetical protein